MRRTIWTIVFLLPLSAFALDYTNSSLLYTDAPFAPAERAGINVLTNLGAVEGNPDGTFRPNRTLNRAEFLKIVLLSSPTIRVATSDADSCFPDVQRSDWFSKYVCLAKKRGIVSGYPDGQFKPGNSVNYAEALKILGEIYNYTAWTDDTAPWYQVYVQAAMNHKVALPINLPYDRELTRGQMARLAAAYRAEQEGELELYRAAERGKDVFVPQEDEEDEEEVEDEEEISFSSFSSSSSSASSQEPDEPYPLPSVSHLLRTGERSGPIADGHFTVYDDNAYLRLVKVELDREVISIETMHLVDEQGREIGTLSLDSYDKDNETWKGSFAGTGAYILTKDKPMLLAIEVTLKRTSAGGIPKEIVEVRNFGITVQGVTSGQSKQIPAVGPHYPLHQTVVGTLTGITNAQEDTGVLSVGKNRLIGSFQFTGDTTGLNAIRILHLTFDAELSFGVAVSNWSLGIATSPSRHSCTVEDKVIVSCLSIPESMGTLEGGLQTINLYGDIVVGGTTEDKTLQVKLLSPGTIGSFGSVRWSDGTGEYTWTELDEPVAEGTVWDLE